MADTYKATKSLLAKTAQDLTSLALQVDELKVAQTELDTAQAYIKNVEEAVTPIVDTFIPEPEDGQSRPLIERLKQVPDLAMGYVREAAKVLFKHLLVVVQNRWANVEVQQVT